MNYMNEVLNRINDIERQLGALSRLDVAPSPASIVLYAGTPVAGNYAYWSGAGTIRDSGFGTSQLPRYSGTPTAGAITYWTGAGTVAHATFGTADVITQTLGDARYGRLGTVNTWASAQTFTSGIIFGNETLANYDEGTWSPAITGSSSNPTITYTSQLGYYTRIGNLVFFTVLIVINTVSGGSGTCRVSLPFTVANQNTVNGVVISGPDVTGTPFAIAFEAETGQTYGNVRLINDNAGISNLAVTDLAATDIIRVSGFFFV